MTLGVHHGKVYTMEVGIKEFRNNISKYLKSLPVTLTKRGKPFAIIQKASDLSNIPKETKRVFSKIMGKWLEV